MDNKYNQKDNNKDNQKSENKYSLFVGISAIISTLWEVEWLPKYNI